MAWRRFTVTNAVGSDFLLVRSQYANRLFEVHTRHTSCGRSPLATCNCAVAVREGNDILGIQACNQTPTPVRYLRDPDTPDGKADIIKDYGRQYRIVMPSGSYVRVYVLSSGFLNIYVYPILEDAYQTTGLCGNYDLNRENDVVISDPDQHRLQPEESYINGHIHTPQCIVTGQVATICRCDDGQASFNCTEDTSQTPVRIFDTEGKYFCSSSGRRKRSVADDGPMDDNVITADDFPIPPTPNITEPPPPRTWPSASGITEQQATEECERVLKSYPAYNTCTNYVDMQIAVIECATNILLLDDIDDGVSSVVQNLQETCKFEIESTRNSTDEDTEPDPVEQVLRAVNDVSCPGQTISCSGHGTCTNSRCVCDTGYVRDDCSLAADAEPRVISFRRGSTCDARLFTCSKAFITVHDFYESPTLTCRLVDYQQSNLVFNYVAKPLSTIELECPLPESPVSSTSSSARYTWDISVSNNGQIYSNQLQLTVYDSKCLSCYDAGSCQRKASTCLIDGNCYNALETNPADPSKTCVPTQSGTDWTQDKTTPTSTQGPPSASAGIRGSTALLLFIMIINAM